MGNRREIIDGSHAVEDGMITYKGLPAPLICDYLSHEESRSHYAEGTEFHIGKIEMVANTGTYVDAPFHRFADGKDLSELPLDSFADLETIIVRSDQDGERAIGRDRFADLGDLVNKAVLVNTGWDANWRTDRYFEGHPFLAREAAEYLVDADAALVEIERAVRELGARGVQVFTNVAGTPLYRPEYRPVPSSLPAPGRAAPRPRSRPPPRPAPRTPPGRDPPARAGTCG